MSEQSENERNNQPGTDGGSGPAGGPGLPPRPATPPQSNPGGGQESQPPYSSWNATQPLATGQPRGASQQGWSQYDGGAHGTGTGHGNSAYGGQGTAPYSGGAYPAGTYAPSTAKAPAKRFGAPTLIAGMLAAALVGGGAAVGTNYLIVGDEPAAVSAPANGNQGVVINNPENVTAVTAAAAKASPSVVTLEVTGGSASGSGSGVILDAEGHILTNTHVVTLGGATGDANVTVRTSDGTVHNAAIVGTDPLSDLAVVKIDADNLSPATLGSSSQLNVGDTAIAIGAPLGLSGTVTDGIVSTLNRTISVQSSAVPEQGAEGQPEDGGDEFNFQFPGVPQQGQGGEGSIYINVIQTDAAINHGNSGGALVNVNGEIIGINVAIASDSEDSGSIGVGFAIPIDYAKRIANDLIAHGEASHGLLGVTVQARPAKTAAGNTSFSVGAQVHGVEPGSPAAEAGLKAGDIITGVGDRAIDSSTSLTAAIREYAAGSKATIHYTRDGGQHSAEVTVGASEG